MTGSTKVLLVDDHAMVRSGLRALLGREPGMEVVGEASDGRHALELAKDLRPDVMVMDIRMPDLNGIDATRQALAHQPGLKVIALSAQSDDRTATEMLRAGVAGYVVKEAAYEELASAIRAVVKGMVYFSPGVAKRLNKEIGRQHIDGDNSAFARLSSRERETLQLISEGKATKEVAAILHVSVKTAETHRRNIMEKLGIDNVAELTKYAIREGLTSV